MTSPRQRLTWTGEVASQLPWSHAVIWVGVVVSLFGCGLLFWYSAIKGVKPSAPIYTIWGLLIVAGLLMVVGGLIARAFRAKNQVTPERSSWGLVAPLDSTWFWNPLSRRETTSVCSRLVLVDGKFPCRGGNGGLLGVA